MTIHIAIADDHPIIREGLRHLLTATPQFEIVAEAAGGLAAIQTAEVYHPEIMVMDIAMPELNGIEATREILTRCPEIKVVILSVHSSPEYIYQAFSAGAKGYVLKESIGKELVDAIWASHSNKRYLSKKIEKTILHNGRFADTHSPLEDLSQRERQVLQLVVNGFSSAAVAEKLDLSPKTVETYRSRIMKKLNVQGITSLVKFAIRHGLTDLE